MRLLIPVASTTAWGCRAIGKSGASRPPMTRNTPPRAMPIAAAQQGEQNGFQQKLDQDGARLCADSLAQTDFAGAFGDGYQHDIHHADAADQQRNSGDSAQEDGD